MSGSIGNRLRVSLAQAPSSYPRDLETIEVQLLMEGIFQQYGFDFRSYAYTSLKRRLWKRILAEGLTSISGLQELVLHHPDAMERLLLDLSVNVSTMFRDPEMYLSFRNEVVPLLRTYPFVRIWHAGCSTGEEVYSLAILLQEEGLGERVRIYATDINEAVLQVAKEGIYPLEKMKEYTTNYLSAGGKRAFSEYYTANYDRARFDPALRRNVVFSQHNLVTDRSFAEFNVILCRNVMIYFDRSLQERVHALFYESLARFGVLVLGHKESLRTSKFEPLYEAVDAKQKIYRRIE